MEKLFAAKLRERKGTFDDNSSTTHDGGYANEKSFFALANGDGPHPAVDVSVEHHFHDKIDMTLSTLDDVFEGEI
jgi:hypothetical protein